MKQIIILIGPPGSGKGTQAELLSEKLNLYYFETSKILEQNFKGAEGLLPDSSERFFEIEGQKYDILNEYKLWKEGKLCSPPFVTFLVQKKIKELAQEGKNLLLAGSPRTLYEGERIMPVLENLYGKENIKIIFLEISPEQTIYRNSHRRLCELMRHPILYNKETENLTICPLDGSKLVKRVGLDDPETIKVRIKEYKERTLPLFEYFKKEGLNVLEVNGEQSVSEVYEDILKALKQ